MNTKPKCVLIILDDVGWDMINATRLPNLEAFMANAAKVQKYWSMPNCSPTRATMMTGKFPFRTGIGTAIGDSDTVTLSESHATIASLMPPSSNTVMLGKWHMCNIHDLGHPNRMGFKTFIGSMGNLNQDGVNYYAWTKVTNGLAHPESEYATSYIAKQAGRALNKNVDLLVVSFNAPHVPLHIPPDGSFSIPLCNLPIQCPSATTQAMLQAVDFYLGQHVLSNIDLSETYVVVVSDNGSSQQFASNPERAKGTVYEDGIRVPLMIAGPGIIPGDADFIACSVDIFATVLEMCGVSTVNEVTDSVSMLPMLRGEASAEPRQWAFSQRFSPNGSSNPTLMMRAVRNLTHKLISTSDEVEELYDLSVDPWEQNPLPLNGDQYNELKKLLNSLQ